MESTEEAEIRKCLEWAWLSGLHLWLSTYAAQGQLHGLSLSAILLVGPIVSISCVRILNVMTLR